MKDFLLAIICFFIGLLLGVNLIGDFAYERAIEDIYSAERPVTEHYTTNTIVYTKELADNWYRLTDEAGWFDTYTNKDNLARALEILTAPFDTANMVEVLERNDRVIKLLDNDK